MRKLPVATTSTAPPASAGILTVPGAPRSVVVASYLLMVGALMLVMLRGLLPGLLFACIGFLGTRWLTRAFNAITRRLNPARIVKPASSLSRILAAAVVMLAPIGLLILAFAEGREFVLHAPEQYRDLLDYIARTVLELRLKLPPEVAVYLPEGVAEVQGMIAGYLRAQAGELALTGRAWLGALLFSYVGLIVGALAATALPQSGSSRAQQRPLTQQLQLRIALFGETFGQIVAAQFWIAAFNTLLTAIFLMVLLPLWGLRLPYELALITLTFIAGLVPIVGNLLCNAVITMVGLSVSPLAAVACLVFLILIHKGEYLINAKVVGSRTRMAVWELLAVMFVAEAVFGPTGLVAAPLFYAYLKKELQAARLV